MGFSSLAAEFDIGLNGKVGMQGSILAQACTLSMDSKYQSIDMGVENVARLARTGEGRIKPFSIYLTDCTLEDNLNDSIPWHYLQVTFDGAGDDGLFSVMGSAGGIGLKVTDRLGNSAVPGKAMPYARVDNKNIRLDYQLRLMKNHSELSVGNYSTIIKYRVSYF